MIGGIDVSDHTFVIFPVLKLIIERDDFVVKSNKFR